MLSSIFFLLISSPIQSRTLLELLKLSEMSYVKILVTLSDWRYISQHWVGLTADCSGYIFSGPLDVFQYYLPTFRLRRQYRSAFLTNINSNSRKLHRMCIYNFHTSIFTVTINSSTFHFSGLFSVITLALAKGRMPSKLSCFCL